MIAEKSVFNEVASEGCYVIKPHHFLDYLYDLAIGNRHDEPDIYGSANGALCRKFIDGELERIKFTPFTDDICKPCKKLVYGKMCTDCFDDKTTLCYGFRYKNDFNYQLDMKLNVALPDIFCFDKEQNTFDVLCALEKNLTGDILGLYLWNRPDRVKNTFSGIEKGKIIYKKIPEKIQS